MGRILGAAGVTLGEEFDRGIAVVKGGVIVERGAGWEANLIDGPFAVFWDYNRQRWGGAYIGYSDAAGNPEFASIGLAYADDPLGPWEKHAGNPILERSGVPGAADENGVTGPLVWWEPDAERVYLFYIGLTGTGYEGGGISLCVASTAAADFPTGWTRHGPVIEPAGTGWRSDAVYHPSIVERRGRLYVFFNATGDVGGVTEERIGYATATHPLGPWTVDDDNSPVLGLGAAAAWDEVRVADPAVYRVGERWYMAYYGIDAGGSLRDGLAWTTDDDFPLGPGGGEWARHESSPIVDLGPAGSADGFAAFKPFVLQTSAGHYHYYCAQETAARASRAIAVAVAGRPVAAVPWLIEPHGGNSRFNTQDVGANNRGVRRPLTVEREVTVTGVGFVVAVSAGNVGVALYDEDNRRIATSGTVACPAAGEAAVNFTAPVTLPPGRYSVVLASSTTGATFATANPTGAACPFAFLMANALPPPAAWVDGGRSRGPVLFVMVDGGAAI